MNDHAILDPRMLQGVPAEQAMASMIQWAVRIKASDLFFCLGRDAAWVAVRQQGVVRRVSATSPPMRDSASSAISKRWPE